VGKLALLKLLALLAVLAAAALLGMACPGGGQGQAPSPGDPYAWGWNDRGQLGDGTVTTDRPTPTQVSGLTDVVAVAGGGRHSLALKSDGTV